MNATATAAAIESTPATVKTRIIANPHAGGLEDHERLHDAAAGLGAELCFTESPGEAEELARASRAAGFRRLVAAGGDGTLNEVVNGLAPDFDGVQLALLPLGTGNDFAKSIGVPAELEQAVKVLETGRARRLDVGRARRQRVRYFLNMSAGGASCEVSEALDKETKRAWGPLAYLRSAVEVAFEPPTYNARIHFDDGDSLELEVLSVLVANGRRVAGGIRAAPEARLDDGLFDVLVVPALGRGRIAMLLPQILAGAHLGSELLHFRRSRSLRVESEPPMSFNLDGEVVGAGEITFDLLPRALEVVVGELDE